MKKKTNFAAIAAGLVAVCLIAVISVLAVKAKNGSAFLETRQMSDDSDSAVTSVYIQDFTSSTYRYDQNDQTSDYSETSTSIFDVLTTTQQAITSAINTVTQLTEPGVQPTTEATTAAPTEATTEKNTVTEKTTEPVTSAEYETEVSKASAASVAAASDWKSLPMDMTFAGLSKSGYSVIGFKQYIYNDDMSPTCAQRNLGYNSFYDIGANFIDFSIDTVKLKFNYDGKTYRIQLWKGQYISGEIGTVGGEVGIYTHKGTNYSGDHFNCAGAGDELYQEMSILWDEDRNGNYIPQFTANYALHWWETGYVDGQLPNKRDSNPLRLLSRMTFKDEAQATAFENALVAKGFTRVDTFDPTVPDTCKRYGKNVIYEWWNVR